MKCIFAILFICLAASKYEAAVIGNDSPANLEARVNDIVQEVENIAIDVVKTLEHQMEEIVLDPLHEVDNAVQVIEDQRSENEACVAVEDERVTTVVNAMHSEMATCGTTAAHSSAEIAVDVSDATQQLVFDGYDVLKTYQKCKKYKNVVLKNSCYARLSVKATFYLKNAPKSIRTIKKATNERVPAVFTDADLCTHAASERAVTDLQQVIGSIDACIAK